MMLCPLPRAAGLALVFGLLAWFPLHAQEPPAGRAPQPTQSDDGFVDKMQAWATEHEILERLNGSVDGWYPRLGRMTRGSGIALGPGYRRHVVGDRLFVDISAGLSTKGYKAADVNVRWLQAFNQRFELWSDLRYEDFPQEDFFGPF